jgi:hypothetical protein
MGAFWARGGWATPLNRAFWRQTGQGTAFPPAVSTRRRSRRLSGLHEDRRPLLTRGLWLAWSSLFPIYRA